ncbi:germ cell nuclear acidic protein [Myripristis murdjan]|uniref:Germ cell nuclear acidic peptidase n=1 Tax=Myripristis murdjan TaxID=586833 RepID=A0A667WTF3_9TELE|nr:acidic repeat-containing protein-like [Myripristis murdjan]XP_029917239.1 acidic repeat-containing protein-like [Myripristis murdjan]
MDEETHKLFHRVAKKMGWTDDGLDTAEEKLVKSIGKARHPATSGHRFVGAADLASPVQLHLSESEDDPEKENQYKGNEYRNKAVESSDDDSDQFLVQRATPNIKAILQKPCSAAEKDSTYVVVSSDSDGSFETFLNRVKTPNARPKKISESGSEDSLKNFIVNDSSDDDFIKMKSSSRVSKKTKTPTAQHPVRRPLAQCDYPVFVSDSDSDGDIVIKSTWKARHSRPQLPQKANKTIAQNCDQKVNSPCEALPPLPSPAPLPALKTIPASFSTPASPKRIHSAPSKLNDSSSEEEFISLLDRLKKKNKLLGNSPSPANIRECNMKPPVSVPPVKGLKAPASRSLDHTPEDMKTPGKPKISKPTVSQTEPRPGPSSRIAVCKTPGCFLQSLSAPSSSHNFKQNKEELTSKLYKLYNTSVFDSKLPTSMSLTWNKKMRKTAGFCITGQERGGGNRYARIELSDKVCDSADRLRDTLIHEMCHAATWLINGVRDGHGSFWKLYARKATLAHPELPMVTRCHSYDIKYKYQYQCTRCQNTIGRHSKSLDTQRFACALCTGQLVLLTPSKPRAPTPFANFVKENYGNVRQELVGQSHAEVMRKLSADFAAKTKLSQS